MTTMMNRPDDCASQRNTRSATWGRPSPQGLMGVACDSGNCAATTAPEPASMGFGVVTVMPSQSWCRSLKPDSVGYCIALIAVTNRSLTLSGNGTYPALESSPCPLLAAIARNDLTAAEVWAS